jgi:lysyl-tRNA synthetase class 1
MSSSEGIIFTLPQWLEIAEPELLRFFVFQSKPMKAKGFDPGVQVLDLYDEFDFTEEVYFKKSGASPSKVAQLSRIYELSRIGRIPDRAPQRVSFRFAAVLCQAVKGDREKAVEILTKRKVFVDPSPSDVELAMRRLELAGKWVERYAPPELRFTISETLPAGIKEKLTAEQKEGLKELARSLSERDFSPIELHNHIYDIAKKIDLEPAKLFQAIYLVLLGRSSGPRAGTFISALDRGFVTERFREATI